MKRFTAGGRLLGWVGMGLLGWGCAWAQAQDADKMREALDGAISIKSQEAVQYVPVKDVQSSVSWATRPIRIDGDLSDWSNLGTPAVVLEGPEYTSWDKGEYGGKEDLSATLWLCRDDQNLYVALKIADDQLPPGGRITLAFADAKTKPIHGWRDVGQRAGADDVHVIFVVGKDGAVGMHWAHYQQRMDVSEIQDSFGSEAERLALLEQKGSTAQAHGKIFSRATVKLEGEKSATVFEAAFPWKTLMPYVPVSYQPLKFNVSVTDVDGGNGGGSVAWLPGLVGTYDAGHFANLTFAPRQGRNDVEAFAQVPTFQYINHEIPAEFSLYNNGAAAEGELQLLANGKVVASEKIKVPAGFSQKTVKVNSEKLDAGRVELRGRLVVAGHAPVEIAVNAPTRDDKVVIRKVAEYDQKIATLERNAQALEALYDKVKAAGLDTAYPLAYVTLQKMFIPRTKLDLKAGDAERVLKNTAYLEALYGSSRAYMQEILKDPSKQLKVPAKFNPDKLVMKDGYYFDGDRPVFLWGPCTFWYLRQDTPLVIDLGFNSTVTEVPQDAGNADVRAVLEQYYKAGVSLNASIAAPSLQLTGADAKRSSLLKEHPEVANVDQNNFLSFLVQHPIVRAEIQKDFAKSIGFWKQFPGIRSYWLWNEPWYLNYSELTRQDFIKDYLKPKYKTIEALNQRWKSAYKSFDEIQLIQWPDAKNYAPWYDFQQFRDDLLADFWAFLNKTAKDIDPNKPTHVKFMAASLHSGNMEKYQAPFDIAGHDGSAGDRDMVFMDYMRSLFPDRPLVDTEVHIYYGGKKPVGMTAWRLALHGLADGNWWCWHSNQRFSDSLANAESMDALAISGLDLQRLMDPYIFNLNQKPTNVAMLFPDVVERRSDVKMVRIRFELAPALYELGVRPFYVAESRIPKGELSRHKLLLAGESDYVKDSTYQGVLEYVKSGGTAVVMRGGFAHNEYGDPRDAGELIHLQGGEAYGPNARIYPLGQGKVICIDAIENQPDVVIDGGQGMRGGPLPEHITRRAVYRQVMEQAMTGLGLNDAVRVVAADYPAALVGIEWRSAEIPAGHVLALLPYGAQPPFAVKLQTARPIKRLVNLITQEELALNGLDFSKVLVDGPNLFLIELEK